MTPDQIEAHSEATAPQTPEQIAAGMTFDQLSADTERKVLDIIAKNNGITADALNMSVSKFKRLNKEQLVNYIKQGAPKEQTKTAPADQEGGEFDLIGFTVKTAQITREALKKGDYQKLDAHVMETVGAQLSSGGGESLIKIDANSKNLTYALVGGGILYAAARFIGFDVISKKAEQIGGKILSFGKNANANRQ